MHQAIDRGGCRHRVFEDLFPFRKRKIAAQQDARTLGNQLGPPKACGLIELGWVWGGGLMFALRSLLMFRKLCDKIFDSTDVEAG